jgi:hypothetical protein
VEVITGEQSHKTACALGIIAFEHASPADSRAAVDLLDRGHRQAHFCRMSITPGQPEKAVGTSDSTGGNSSQPPDDQADETVNLTIVWFLGLALLALVGTLIGFSVSKTTFPDGLTSLASLIAGGLLGIVNPSRGKKQGSTQGNSRRTLLGRRPPA